MEILENVEVEYKTFQGWQTDITTCRDYKSLPDNFIQVPSIYIYI